MIASDFKEWGDILKLTGINAALIAAVATWLKGHFDRKLERFRFEQQRRERAAMIAELFAEWIAKPSDFKRLNQLSFEASLWLPDDVVVELSKMLTNSADAKNIKELLVDVRRHLMGKSDAVEPGHIIHFDLSTQAGSPPAG